MRLQVSCELHLSTRAERPTTSAAENPLTNAYGAAPTSLPLTDRIHEMRMRNERACTQEELIMLVSVGGMHGECGGEWGGSSGLITVLFMQALLGPPVTYSRSSDH
jgi:hypothetical protein